MQKWAVEDFLSLSDKMIRQWGLKQLYRLLYATFGGIILWVCIEKKPEFFTCL
jgi:hypothetical protein